MQILNHEEIFQKIENRLNNYETFEKLIIRHIQTNYFPFVYQSLYSQLGYEKFELNRFNNTNFNNFIISNNFIDLINEIYRTRLSAKGVNYIFSTLKNQNFDFGNYRIALSAFEKCNPTKNKNGILINANAWSFGTKILHFYNPEKYPILDSVVRDNLKLGEMTYNLCIEFKKAANDFVDTHSNYFEEFYMSENIKIELRNRYMTNKFPKMEIMDMALYD